MKIEIDYNGAFAACRIEPMEELGKMVNFNEADTKSQTYALSAFQTIKEHWKREKQKECDMTKNILPTPEPTVNDVWEQRRYELAKAALIGLSGKAMPIEVAAMEAVVYADAVIEELKK